MLNIRRDLLAFTYAAYTYVYMRVYVCAHNVHDDVRAMRVRASQSCHDSRLDSGSIRRV